jgi:hypothetical protein
MLVHVNIDIWYRKTNLMVAMELCIWLVVRLCRRYFTEERFVTFLRIEACDSQIGSSLSK